MNVASLKVWWKAAPPWQKGALVGLSLSIVAVGLSLYGAFGQLLFGVTEGYEATEMLLFMIGIPLTMLSYYFPSNMPLALEIGALGAFVVIEWTAIASLLWQVIKCTTYRQEA